MFTRNGASGSNYQWVRRLEPKVFLSLFLYTLREVFRARQVGI